MASVSAVSSVQMMRLVRRPIAAPAVPSVAAKRSQGSARAKSKARAGSGGSQPFTLPTATAAIDTSDSDRVTIIALRPMSPAAATMVHV